MMEYSSQLKKTIAKHDQGSTKTKILRRAIKNARLFGQKDAFIAEEIERYGIENFMEQWGSKMEDLK